MYKAPIKIAFVDQKISSDPDFNQAWTHLQSVIGAGLVSAEVKGPERRHSWPILSDFKVEAPVASAEEVQQAVTNLSEKWHFAIEEVMNRRWNLVDSPYAKMWAMPGMILLHQAPLGWEVDAQSQSIADGEALEDPTWLLLMPYPKSNHGQIAMHKPTPIPHADILSKALTEAAREEGHDLICPLSWEVESPSPDDLDIIEA